MALRAPVFVIGTGRSGTTLIFEVLAAHEDLGWFSQHCDRLPGVPAVSLLSRLTDLTPALRKSTRPSTARKRWLEKLRIGPVEPYVLLERCCGEKFRYDYLLGVKATQEEHRALRSAVASCLRYHGKPRFAMKVTGPPRIGYLSSIFPDALFLHVIRDARAVVQSLMRVPFWRDSFRMRQPAWRNGLSPSDLAAWEETGHSPAALAAIQWRSILHHARNEARALAPEQYAEVRYEDFVKHPHSTLERILEHCRLPPSERARAFLEERFDVRDMNPQWRTHLDPDEIALVESLAGDVLEELGYGRSELHAPGVSEFRLLAPNSRSSAA